MSLSPGLSPQARRRKLQAEQRHAATVDTIYKLFLFNPPTVNIASGMITLTYQHPTDPSQNITVELPHGQQARVVRKDHQEATE